MVYLLVTFIVVIVIITSTDFTVYQKESGKFTVFPYIQNANR